MYKFGSVVALFLGFALFGGAFMGLIALIPAGLPRDVTVCSIGVVFSAAFLYLLLARLKNLYAGKGAFWVEAAMATANLALLLSAFAVIYKVYGAGAAGTGVHRHGGTYRRRRAYAVRPAAVRCRCSPLYAGEYIAPARNRTLNLLIKSQLLYRLSYRGVASSPEPAPGRGPVAERAAV